MRKLDPDVLHFQISLYPLRFLSISSFDLVGYTGLATFPFTRSPSLLLITYCSSSLISWHTWKWLERLIPSPLRGAYNNVTMFQRRYRLFHFLFIIIMQTFPVLYIPTLEVIGKWKAPDILLSSWSFVEDPAISVYICTALLFNYVNPWQSDLVEHQRSPKICDRVQYKMHPLHLNFKVTSFHPLDAFAFRFYDLGQIACWHIMHSPQLVLSQLASFLNWLKTWPPIAVLWQMSSYVISLPLISSWTVWYSKLVKPWLCRW